MKWAEVQHTHCVVPRGRLKSKRRRSGPTSPPCFANLRISRMRKQRFVDEKHSLHAPQQAEVGRRSGPTALPCSTYFAGKSQRLQMTKGADTGSLTVVPRGRLKSKRRRSGPTALPCCATPSPSTFRSADCRRWVAVWCALVRRRAPASTSAVTCKQPMDDVEDSTSMSADCRRCVAGWCAPLGFRV